jgi:hypothetical protein
MLPKKSHAFLARVRWICKGWDHPGIWDAQGKGA